MQNNGIENLFIAALVINNRLKIERDVIPAELKIAKRSVIKEEFKLEWPPRQEALLWLLSCKAKKNVCAIKALWSWPVLIFCRGRRLWNMTGPHEHDACEMSKDVRLVVNCSRPLFYCRQPSQGCWQGPGLVQVVIEAGFLDVAVAACNFPHDRGLETSSWSCLVGFNHHIVLIGWS